MHYGKFANKIDYEDWSTANGFIGTSHRYNKKTDTVKVYGTMQTSYTYSYSVANSYSYTTMDQTMRQTTVSIAVSGLTPLATGFYLTFSGQQASLTPATGYSEDTTGNGTVTTDSNGSFQGSFTVPAGIAVGTVEVVFTNGKDQAIATYTGSGNTVHQGVYYTEETGIGYETVRATVTYDPLAETFQLPQDSYITSFNLFFGSKDDTEPVRIQLRPTDSAGYPADEYYFNQIIYPKDINTSENGSVLTNIKLDKPFLATANVQYAIVLASQSDSYTTFVATLGEKYLSDSSTVVNQQPYTNGTLFTSDTGTAFSAEHNSDLEFGINIAKFNATGTIVFNPIQNIQIDTMILLADCLTPNNTDCNWYYRELDQNDSSTTNISSKPWVPLADFIKQHFDTVVKEVQLEAVFNATDYSSPIINLDSLSLGRWLTAITGNYIGKTIDSTAAPYNTLHIKYSANIPSGASVTPYYSTDTGNTWKQLTTTPSTVAETGGFTQYSYDQTVGTNGATFNSFKIKLVLTGAVGYKIPQVKNLMCTFSQE